MTDLALTVTGVRPERYAAVPTLAFGLTLAAPDGTRVDGVALRCQIRIEPNRRRHAPAEATRLRELFGDTPQWGDTLKPFLWTHVATLVPRFVGSRAIELAVPCTYDFEVAAAKYLHALDDGEIPLLFLFSGSVFGRRGDGLDVVPVAWDRESRFRLPVRIWRALMDHYFPNAGWLRLQRDTLDGLARFKAVHALPTFDAVIAELLTSAAERAA